MGHIRSTAICLVALSFGLSIGSSVAAPTQNTLQDFHTKKQYTSKTELDTTGQHVSFNDESNNRIIDFGELLTLNTRGRKLPTQFSLEGKMLAILFDTTNAAHPIAVDPLVTSPSWSISSTNAGSEFGYVVYGTGNLAELSRTRTTIQASSVTVAAYIQHGLMINL